MDFLTPGEKIKKMRTELDIKQHQLTVVDITRNFISMLESNKRKLSRETAVKLLDVIRSIAEQKNVVLNMSVDELLQEPERQAEAYCRKQMAKDIFDLDEILEISKRYSLNDILLLSYRQKADEAYDEANYLNAFIYYLDALDLARMIHKDDSLALLYNKLGKCKLVQIQYREAFMYFQRALDYSVQSDDVTMRKNITYNLALCCLNMEDQSNALELIGRYFELCNAEKDIDDIVRATILKSNCYLGVDNLKEAKNCYFEVMDKIKDEHSIFWGYIYNNLGLIYMDLNEYQESFYYFRKSEAFREEFDQKNLSHTLIDKSTAYFEMNEYDKAIGILEEAIPLALENNDRIYALKGCNLLKQIYLKKNNRTGIESMYQRIIDILKDSDDEKELLENYIKLSLLYLEKGDVDSCRSILLESSDRIGIQTN